ncbi:hypothetical protein FIBSPDRAFT_747770 [Athelia psychrophila]|uniref:Galactose oxidase n=1 Tax=Athelia psychrophila TaxID=1759441 RepID=A0A166FNT7_9AGAM|nr:hypothetical protein FIBSPDRAFT_747770 [Fibularhizoctonia sp. CBS 109695]
MIGDRPSYNDWASRIVSVDRNAGDEFYLIGGCAEGDEIPSSDIFRMELKSMRWTNLTDQTKFPGSSGFWGNHVVHKPIPAVHSPAISAFYSVGRRFLLSFGGRQGKEGPPSQDLIGLDLDSLIWSIIPVEGGAVRGRMSATMVVVGQKLFIFGGLGWNKDAGECEVVNTFSVAECTGDENYGHWMWLVRDLDYPAGVPSLGFCNLQGIPVYEGKKILLTAGRLKNDEPFSLSGQTCVLFSPTNYSFQTQAHTPGDFPEDVGWYFLDALTITTPSDASALPSQAPAAQFVAWTPYDHDSLVPELWRYTLPPEEDCRSLNLREQMWGMRLDFAMFAVIGGRHFFFARDSETSTTYTTCVEIKL